MNFEAISTMLERGRYLVSDHMFEAVRNFYMNGFEPGGFLRAVMMNDLFGAYDKADSHNKNAMSDWVMFFYNYTPSGSWGSQEKYERWLEDVRKAIEEEGTKKGAEAP